MSRQTTMSHDWHVAEASEAALAGWPSVYCPEDPLRATPSRFRASLVPANDVRPRAHPRPSGRCGSGGAEPDVLARANLRRAAAARWRISIFIASRARTRRRSSASRTSCRAARCWSNGRSGRRACWDLTASTFASLWARRRETRSIHMRASGTWEARLRRIEAISDFLFARAALARCACALSAGRCLGAGLCAA